jgi:hypothetical protein
LIIDENIFPGAPPMPSLSAKIQSDLTSYHQRLADASEGSLDADHRIIAARALEAIRDARYHALLIMETALGYLAAGEPELAKKVLETAAEHYRDRVKGAVQ